MTRALVLSADRREKVINAVRHVQRDIHWKPHKDSEHLQTRKRYGHLAPEATIDDYHQIITSLVNATEAHLYIYVWQDGTLYPTIVSEYNQRVWLVMISLSGVLETAFPPTNPSAYLADERFYDQGKLQEFLA